MPPWVDPSPGNEQSKAGWVDASPQPKPSVITEDDIRRILAGQRPTNPRITEADIQRVLKSASAASGTSRVPPPPPGYTLDFSDIAKPIPAPPPGYRLDFSDIAKPITPATTDPYAAMAQKWAQPATPPPADSSPDPYAELARKWGTAVPSPTPGGVIGQVGQGVRRLGMWPARPFADSSMGWGAGF